MKPAVHLRHFAILSRNVGILIGSLFWVNWNPRKQVATFNSKLLEQVVKLRFFDRATLNWKLQLAHAGSNLLRANCQSKYQHCMTILQSGAQTNNWFYCNLAFKSITNFILTVPGIIYWNEMYHCLYTGLCSKGAWVPQATNFGFWATR